MSWRQRYAWQQGRGRNAPRKADQGTGRNCPGIWRSEDTPPRQGHAQQVLSYSWGRSGFGAGQETADAPTLTNKAPEQGGEASG